MYFWDLRFVLSSSTAILLLTILLSIWIDRKLWKRVNQQQKVNSNLQERKSTPLWNDLADSVASLERFAELQPALAQELESKGAKELIVDVTFRHPLTIDAFKEWAKSKDFNVQTFTLRVMNPNGETVTVGGAPTNGEIVEDAHLKRILDHVADYGATDVQGIYEVSGVIPINAYANLRSDKDVFLADVTRSAVLLRLKQSEPEMALDADSIVIKPAFPRMEMIGLEKFK